MYVICHTLCHVCHLSDPFCVCYLLNSLPCVSFTGPLLSMLFALLLVMCVVHWTNFCMLFTKLFVMCVIRGTPFVYVICPTLCHVCHSLDPLCVCYLPYSLPCVSFTGPLLCILFTKLFSLCVIHLTPFVYVICPTLCHVYVVD